MAAQAGAQTRLLVVGAGPTGLMMASQLARNGVAVRIVDKAPSASTESKALAIQSRTLELFDDLGIIQQTLSLGLPIHAVSSYADGRRIAHVSMNELDSPYPYAIDLPQSQTERILNAYMESFGVQVEREVELLTFTQDDQAVTATLRHANGQDETYVTPWLLACDGAHSAARHTLGLPFEGAAYPEGFALADVRLHWALPEDEWHIFLHPDGVLAVFPMRGGRARLLGDTTVDAPDGPMPAPTLEAMRQMLAVRGPAGATIDDPVWLAGFRIHRRHSPAFRSGRVFLAGDAVHIHSPAGGQGMNTGLQDVYNLAWKLGLVVTGRAPASLLDSYQAEREPVAEALLRATDAMTRLGLQHGPLVAALRNRLYGLLAQQEPIQQRLATRLAELNVGYRHSPIVAEHQGSVFGRRRFSGGPRPGDRAPDARPLARADGSPTTLFDVFRGTHHTLLLFAGPEPRAGVWPRLDSLAGAVSQRYGALIRPYLVVAGEAEAPATAAAPALRDPELHLHHRYGADGECLYLVRPDKYVGYRAQPADQASLEAYLPRIFL